MSEENQFTQFRRVISIFNLAKILHNSERHQGIQFSKLGLDSIALDNLDGVINSHKTSHVKVVSANYLVQKYGHVKACLKQGDSMLICKKNT